MSRELLETLESVNFYMSKPAPCPYLDGRVEQRIFTFLHGFPQDRHLLNSGLTQFGFRRSFRMIYRPLCPGCRACVPVRIPVARFQPRKSQKRCWRKNQDLAWQVVDCIPNRSYFRLFSRYQKDRHADGPMAQMQYEEFCAMLLEGSDSAQLLELRHKTNQELYGIMFYDNVVDGLSAIYSFFAPDYAGRSLGIFLILALIEQARIMELDYVYLGYWVKGSTNMAYKTAFSPLQRLEDHEWKDFSAEDSI